MYLSKTQVLFTPKAIVSRSMVKWEVWNLNYVEAMEHLPYHEESAPYNQLLLILPEENSFVSQNKYSQTSCHVLQPLYESFLNCE